MSLTDIIFCSFARVFFRSGALFAPEAVGAAIGER
jgi:hypothetical protein